MSTTKESAQAIADALFGVDHTYLGLYRLDEEDRPVEIEACARLLIGMNAWSMVEEAEDGPFETTAPQVLIEVRGTWGRIDGYFIAQTPDGAPFTFCALAAAHESEVGDILAIVPRVALGA